MGLCVARLDSRTTVVSEQDTKKVFKKKTLELRNTLEDESLLMASCAAMGQKESSAEQRRPALFSNMSATRFHRFGPN